MYNNTFFDSVLDQLDAGHFNAGLHFLAGALLPASASSVAKPVLRDHMLHRVSEPIVAASPASRICASGCPKSSFNANSVVAALPLPPPKPAASGIFFSR